MLARNLQAPIASVSLVVVGLLVAFVFSSTAISAPVNPAKTTSKTASESKMGERKPMSKYAKEITAMVAQQEKTWNKGDLEGFLDSYARSKDVVYVSNGQMVRGYDSIRDRYLKRYGETKTSMGQLYLTELETSDLGDKHVLCAGKFTVVHHSHVPIYGRFTLILIRTKDGWKITYDHSSQ